MLLSSSETKGTLMHIFLFKNTTQRELVKVCTQRLRNSNNLSLPYITLLCMWPCGKDCKQWENKIWFKFKGPVKWICINFFYLFVYLVSIAFFVPQLTCWFSLLGDATEFFFKCQKDYKCRSTLKSVFLRQHVYIKGFYRFLGFYIGYCLPVL